MFHFTIETDIEQTPKIFGVRALYAFVVVLLGLFSVLIIMVGFSIVKTGIVILINGGVYVFLYYLTESFQANKLTDDHLPDVISNNP